MHVKHDGKTSQSPLVLNSQTSHGMTPLASAAWFSCSYATLELLLGLQDIQINLADNSGSTPLHWLAGRRSFKDKPRMLSLLLDDSRTKVDLADTSGETPLWRAAEAGDADTVRVLCERSDVDPDARNKDGESPLWTARRKRLAAQSAEDIQRYDRTNETLLATGRINADPVDARGWTPALAAEEWSFRG